MKKAKKLLAIFVSLSMAAGTMAAMTTGAAASQETYAQAYMGETFESYAIGTDVTSTRVDTYGISSGTSLTVQADPANSSNKVLKMTTPAGTSGLNFFNMKDSALTDSVDYFVFGFDMRNGDDSSSAFSYMGYGDNIRIDETDIYNNNGLGEKAALGSAKWNNIKLVFDKAATTMYIVVNGVVTNVTATNADFSSYATKIMYRYLSPQYTNYSRANVAYFDNMEIYGVNKSDSLLTFENVASTDNKIHLKFSTPVKLAASNVTINGNAADSVTYSDGEYIVSYSGIVANTTYSVALTNVAGVFGNTLSTTLDVSKGAITETKNYLPAIYSDGTTWFLGHDDFEGYSGTGVIGSENYVTSKDIVRTSDSRPIENIYNVEVSTSGMYSSLVQTTDKDGNATKALEYHQDTVSASDGITSIFQPKPDYDWTVDTANKYYVYHIDMKSGGGTESAFYSTSFDYGLTLYFGSGTVTYAGKTVENAFTPGAWFSFDYIIDRTTSTPTHYCLINGKLIGSKVQALESKAIKNSSPRFNQFYSPKNTANTSMYLDNIAIYTVSGITNNLTASLASTSVKAGAGVAVKFAEAVKGFTADNIEVSGNTVKSVTAQSDGSYLVEFVNPFDVGSQSITVKNVTSVYGNTLTSSALAFTVVSGGTIEKISALTNDAAGNITVSTYNDGAVSTAMILVGEYDSNGKLVKAALQNASVGIGTQTFTFTGMTSGTYKTKAFVWNTSNKPYCAKYSIN